MKSILISHRTTAIILALLVVFFIRASGQVTPAAKDSAKTFSKGDTVKTPSKLHAQEKAVAQGKLKDPNAGKAKKEKQQTPTVSRAEVQKWFVYENKTHPGKTKHKAVAPDEGYLEIYPYTDGYVLNEANKRGWDHQATTLKEHGLDKFSENAVVEYGGVKKWRNGDLCHIYYIWDIGVKGFAVYGFPTNFSNNFYGTPVSFLEPIEEGYKYVLFNSINNISGIAMISSSEPKSLGIWLIKDGKEFHLSYDLVDTFKLTETTNFKDPIIGFSEENNAVMLMSKTSNKVLAFFFSEQTAGSVLIASR